MFAKLKFWSLTFREVFQISKIGSRTYASAHTNSLSHSQSLHFHHLHLPQSHTYHSAHSSSILFLSLATVPYLPPYLYSSITSLYTVAL